MRYLVSIMLLLCATAVSYCEEIVASVEGKVSRISVRAGYIYLFDNNNSKLWKQDQSGRKIAEFRSKGEGPKELKRIVNFQFVNGNIYLFSPDKCICLNNSLEYKDEFKVKSPFVLLSNNTKVSFREERTVKDRKYELLMQAKEDKQLKLNSYYYPQKGGQFTALIPFFRIKVLKNRNSFGVMNPLDRSVMIYSENGNLIKEIQVPGSSKRVTENFKNRFFESIFRDPRFQGQTEMQKMVKKMTVFDEVFPVAQDFYIDAVNDQLFIKTYERKNGKSAFLKYTTAGKFLKKYYLKDDGIDISNQSNFTCFDRGFYYYLYENDEGEYTIYKEKLI